MNTQANEPAYPAQDVRFTMGIPESVFYHGLSKREVFAMAAMQGFLASYAGYQTVSKPEHIAERSVAFADALIASLNHPEGE